MTRWIFRCLLGALLAWAGHAGWASRPLRHAPGVLVAGAPVQMEVPPQTIMRGDFRLTAVARYTLRGRVLGKKRYWDKPQNQLVPIDVAVGWDRMSDQAVLDQFSRLSMGNRFFFYEWASQPPLPREEIERSAANNHIIAADATVARAVRALRRGQLVEMHGWLVEAEGPRGFRWVTSRRRDDTGNGACEVFYVEKILAAEAALPDTTAAVLSVR
jgi:hypothetical protein